MRIKEEVENTKVKQGRYKMFQDRFPSQSRVLFKVPGFVGGARAPFPKQRLTIKPKRKVAVFPLHGVYLFWYSSN